MSSLAITQSSPNISQNSGMIVLHSDSSSSSSLHEFQLKKLDSDSDSDSEEIPQELSLKISDKATSLSLPILSKADKVAKGIFANEYKHISEIINSLQSQILTITLENSKPPEKSWRTYIKKHRTKLQITSIVLTIFGLAGLISGATNAMITKNYHLVGWSFGIGVACLVGGGSLFLYNVKKARDEEFGIDSELEDLWHECNHKKIVLELATNIAYEIEAFYEQWKDFSNEPDEFKIANLFLSMEKISRFSYSNGTYYFDTEKPFKFLKEDQNRLLFMDQICQKLQNGEVALQWKKLKEASVESLLHSNLGSEPWVKLGLIVPPGEMILQFFNTFKDEKPKLVVDEVIEDAKQVLVSSDFLNPTYVRRNF